MAYEEKKQYYCDKCRRTMASDNFYKSNNLEKYGENDGYLHECKKCLTMHVDNWKSETFLNILEEIDVPWVPGEWQSLLQRYGRDRSRITGTTILGRYLSKMKLNQYIDYRWKDTKFIQEISDNRMRDSLRRQGYDAAEIEEAIRTGRTPDATPLPMEEEPEATYDTTLHNSHRMQKTADDLGLTPEDVTYLSNKWGDTYTLEEQIKLEVHYNDMMNSYDIQTTGHKDTVKLICKLYHKAEQLLDIGDVDGYQKTIKSYNDLMHSGNFTAVQNKTDNGEYIDSISELVLICESDGFIPRYYIDSPKDSVDRVLQDLQSYTRSLIFDEANLSGMIEGALKQIEAEKEKAAESIPEDAEDEDMAAQKALEDSLFNDDAKEVEIDDDDLEEFKAWENRQEDEE